MRHRCNFFHALGLSSLDISSNIGTNCCGVVIATTRDAAPALDARCWIGARTAAHMLELYFKPVTVIKIRSEYFPQKIQGGPLCHENSQFSPSISDSFEESVVLYDN
jgi:hypothetical protein